MYKNLNIELARKCWNIQDLSNHTGINYQTLVTKLNGKSSFKFDECRLIKKSLSSELPLESLFLNEQTKYRFL